MSETHAPFWVYGKGRLQLDVRSVSAHATSDGRRPARRSTLRAKGWHLVTVDVDRAGRRSRARNRKVGAEAVAGGYIPIAWYPESTYSVVPVTFLRVVREQVGGRRADVVGVDVAVQRRALLDDRLHRREAGDRARRERAHRAGGDRVDADVLLAEVPGEVAHGRVERRLRDAHHVVVRHRALAAEVRHRHDRAAAARLHQRLRRARARDERVRADVERQPEAVARRVGEAALEILGRGERDRVHEQVEPAVERLADLARRRARRPRPSARRTRSRAGCDDRSRRARGRSSRSARPGR